MRHITQDYLAIQGSATPSEHAFSSGGLMGLAHQSSLSTNIFEALQILKSAYCNGHIAAIHQVDGHIDALVIAFDNNLEGNMIPINPSVVCWSLGAKIYEFQLWQSGSGFAVV